MSSMEQQRMLVDQLRREAALVRIPVSEAAEDLKVAIFQIMTRIFGCGAPFFLALPEVCLGDPLLSHN